MPRRPPPPFHPPMASSHLVIPPPLLWSGLGLELACGMFGWFGSGLLPMVVRVIIRPFLLWNSWMLGASEFSPPQQGPPHRPPVGRGGGQNAQRTTIQTAMRSRAGQTMKHPPRLCHGRGRVLARASTCLFSPSRPLLFDNVSRMSASSVSRQNLQEMQQSIRKRGGIAATRKNGSWRMNQALWDAFSPSLPANG